MCKLLLLLILSAPAWGAVAHVASNQGYCNSSAHSGNMGSNCSSGVKTNTFTHTPTAANNAVLIWVGCAGTSETTVTLTATGWTITQVGSLIGSSAAGYAALFKGYAPSTSAATFTVTFSATCNDFMNDVLDEFSGVDQTNFVDSSLVALETGSISINITPSVANAMVWAVANDSITAVGAIGGTTATKGADDTQQDWTEYRLLSGGSGVQISAAFTGTVPATMAVVSIKPVAGSTVVRHNVSVIWQ